MIKDSNNERAVTTH